VKNQIINIIVKIFFISIFIGAFFAYCEYRLYNTTFRLDHKKNNFENKIDSIQVLVLGSSHSLYGINPDFFPIKGYNLAMVSQSLYYDKEIVVKYIEKMPSLQYVLIEISYFSLWYEVYRSEENWRDKYYFKYWEINPNNSEFDNLKNKSGIEMFGINFTQNAIRKNFKIYFSDNKPTENGWFNPAGLPWNPDNTFFKDSMNEEAGKLAIEKHNKVMHDELFDANKSYLDEILFSIKKKQLIPVIVTLPVYKSYSNNADIEKIKLINKTVFDLCAKYDCKYYNFFYDNNFNSDDFIDNDHLSPSGAEKFSKQISIKIFNNRN